MPFLFVDYDQGAGGEYFCKGLCQSAECLPCITESIEDGRTKFLDSFDQAFLSTDVDIIPHDSPSDLYEIVPAHRTTDLAKKILKDVKSIRIKNPENDDLWQFIKYQQRIKVLDSVWPKKYFVGELRELSRQVKNKDFIEKIKYGMTGVELKLLSQGLEITEESKKKYFDRIQIKELEPNIEYDLTIDYSDLIFNINLVKYQIKQTFDINVTGDWLLKYQQDYEAYFRKT